MSFNAYEQDDDRERFVSLQLRNAWGKGEVTLIDQAPVHGGIVTREQLVDRTMASEEFWGRVKRDFLHMLTHGGAQIRNGE